MDKNHVYSAETTGMAVYSAETTLTPKYSAEMDILYSAETTETPKRTVPKRLFPLIISAGVPVGSP